MAGRARDVRRLDAGEVLSHKGVQVEGLYAVLSGHVFYLLTGAPGRRR